MEMTKLEIKPVFAWYDFWIGFFFDRKKKILYFLPIPCIGLAFWFPVEITPVCLHEGYEKKRVCGACGQLLW